MLKRIALYIAAGLIAFVIGAWYITETTAPSLAVEYDIAGTLLPGDYYPPDFEAAR